MKKFNLVFAIIAIVIAGSLGFMQVSAQTALSGIAAASNSCATTAGATAGTNVGCGAGVSNTDGGSTFVGENAGNANVSGTENTAVGKEALDNNTYASYNLALGFRALFTQNYANSTTAWGTYNTALGYKALYANNPTANNNARFNTAVGYSALYNNTTASNNTAVGYNSLYGNKTGTRNAAFGNNALNGNTYASDNTAVGYNALNTQSYANGNSEWSTFNVAVGAYALFSNQPTANNNGYKNTASGYSSLYTNSTGANNTATGYYALYSNNAGECNTAVGSNALTANNSSTGSGNTAVGNNALSGNTTGGHNTALGAGAGATNTTGTYNTAIGDGADFSANNYTEATAIGANTPAVDASYHVHIGSTSVTDLETQTTWSLYSCDARIKNNVKADIPGLAFINLLKPVTYNLDVHKQNSIIGYPVKKDSLGNIIGVDTVFTPGKYDIEKIKFSGFLAQDVDTASQILGYDFCGVRKPKSANDLYGLSYSDFVPSLVKSVQELSATVDSLKTALKICCEKGSNEKIIPQTDEQVNAINKNTKDIKLSISDEIIIGDARPNPNQGKAEIDYFLPSSVSNAKVVFTDLLGKIINETVLENGYGTISIDTQELPTGSYLYTLIVDGKSFSSKKMVRNK